MSEERITRDEIRLTKIDRPAPHITYIGWSDNMRGAESDPCWQIKRIVHIGTVTTSTYANMGSYSAKWSLRTTYFDAVDSVLLIADALSLAASFNSDVIYLPIETKGSIQVCYTGNNAADGTIKLEWSNNGTDWCTVADSTKTLSIGADCEFYELTELTSAQARLVYTRVTATAGTLTANYVLKNNGTRRRE